MTPLHEKARHYVALGIPVFPLKPGSKEPLPGSHSFLDATLDPDQIDRWWSQADYNIGTSPAATGHVVVDVDVKDGHDGAAVWAKLCAEHGASPNSTLTVRTPSGGQHLWYLGALRPSASQLGDGLDIRSEGSYVLLPPSRVDGKEYEWISQEREAELPAFVVERLSKPERERLDTEPVERADQPYAIAAAYREVADRLAKGELPTIGTRDAYNAQFFMRMHGLGLSQDKTVELFDYLLQESGAPPPDGWPGDWKTLAKIKRIWAEGNSHVNPLGSELHVPVFGSQLWAGNAAVQEATGQSASRFRIRRPSELVQLKPITYWDAEQKFPRVPTGAVAVVYGGSGEHKTNVLLTKLWDIQIKEKANVIYAAGEGSYGLGVRIAAHCTATGTSPLDYEETFGEIPVPYLGDGNDFALFCDFLDNHAAKNNYSKNAQSTRGQGRRNGIDIIVIDTLATALAGMAEDERAASHLTANGAIGRLARRYGCLVICVAHSGQDKGKGIRGSTGFFGNADAVLYVERDRPADVVRLECKKMRDGPDDVPADHYEIVKVGGVPVPQPISQAAYEMLKGDSKFTAQGIGHALAGLQAYDRASGVSSVTLTQSLYPLARGQDPEEWDRAIARLAKKLEREKEALAGLNDERFGGGKGDQPLLWYHQPAS